MAPASPSTSDRPDWSRLQQALTVEAERGFNNIEGKQHTFSEFLRLTLTAPPEDWSQAEQGRWQELGDRFASYEDLSFAQRQQLVADSRRMLHQQRKEIEASQAAAQAAEKRKAAEASGALPPSNGKKRKLPKTDPLVDLRTAPKTDLDKEVTYLKGIGPKNAARLAKLGLLTVRDLLFYFPRDYLDYAKQVDIRELEPGSMATLVGTVKSCNCFSSPKNPKLTIFELVVRDRSGQIKLGRFYAGNRYSSQAWKQGQKRKFPAGATVAASGMVKQGKYGVTLDNPELEILEDGSDTIQSDKVGRVVPVYTLTEGVHADLVRRAVLGALPSVSLLQECIPQGLLTKFELMNLGEAIAQIHYPDSDETLYQARRRLVFDEFFFLQLGLLQRRAQQREKQTSVVLAPKGELVEKFYELLPFELTGAQQRVVNATFSDMQEPVPMNRLVQGDVGSGKTVVAIAALLNAIQSGYQGAFMAPTEVLAEQHYRKLFEWLSQLHIPVELLTGSTKAAKRREIHRELETGELPLLVGTHALIQKPVKFQKLGLVVIDEQHRFGVQQRAQLQQKGDNPHTLTMTATPIPRTLALTLHGDLDVSQIDELPPGRKPIKTTALKGSKDRQHAYELMRREIAMGRQIYVVLPLVEESEKLDLKSAVDEHSNLQNNVFPEVKVGLLHGRMTSAEKDEAIEAFRRKRTKILVSTTVVEVGVDIPNASVMLIEHAERFGLSQLHQLRGRVGRGADHSYCLLMSASKSETAQQRLKVMEQSQDGFFISEMDMRFRGPGQVLGTRQSGLPDFALASLSEDQDVLEIAREAAEKVIEKDESLLRWPVMKAELEYRYSKLMGGAILT